jgi:hypothetical protein
MYENYGYMNTGHPTPHFPHVSHNKKNSKIIKKNMA